MEIRNDHKKELNGIIKQLKAFKKAKGLDDSYDPYKAAYASMPSHAEANTAIQQMYINGHFCYAYKFGVVTNGLYHNVRVNYLFIIIFITK